MPQPASQWTDAQRRAHGRRLVRARLEMASILRTAREMARTADDAGVPITRIASELGVDRLTVEEWLAKH